MSTRRILLGQMAALGIVGAARPARAQSLTTVRVGTFPSDAAGGVFYAQDKGYFTKYGLKVEINITTGGAAAAAAMIGGDLDVSEADPVTIAIAHDKGLPFTFISPEQVHSVRNPSLALVVRDASIRQGKDFNGKTITSNVAHGFASLATNAWIDGNGGDSKTVKWVELPFPAEPEALQRGTVDAFISPEPFLSVGVSNGGHLIPLATLDSYMHAAGILKGGEFTTRDWLAKNPATATAFSNAIRDAHAWANGNPHDAAEIIAKYSKLPIATIEGSKVRGQYAQRLEPEQIQPLIDIAARYGYISKAFPAQDIIA